MRHGGRRRGRREWGDAASNQGQATTGNCSQESYLRDHEGRNGGDLCMSSGQPRQGEQSSKGSFTSLCSEPLRGPSQRLEGTAQAWPLVGLWLKWGLRNSRSPALFLVSPPYTAGLSPLRNEGDSSLPSEANPAPLSRAAPWAPQSFLGLQQVQRL